MQPTLAQAGSPFETGAANAQVSVLAILTPIALVAVMASGTLAWFGKISWWYLIGVVVGIVLVFGAPQIVSWVRGLAGV